MNRIMISIIALFLRSGQKRAMFYKKIKLFHSIGDCVMIQSWKVPLYSKLISIGNNVRIASNVTFCTHDVAHKMLNYLEKNNQYQEMVGCIQIGDNVFIGANSTILYNVKIGSNIIIASGSVVSKDLEDGYVYGGVPVRKIGLFEDFVKKRKIYSNEIHNINKNEAEYYFWKKFKTERE